LLLCFQQKELDACQHFFASSGSREHEKLGRALAEYFYCRSLMADKMGIKDPIGDSQRETLQKFSDIQPSSVGIRLSACLIVKDEAANLRRCLESIRGIADEIVVVDTGSTDETLQIAMEFGAIIGQFAWCDDFAAARNASLELATGDWVLWIDADEELVPGSETMLREALMRPQFGGYFIQIDNFMRDEADSADCYVHTPIRLFRRNPNIQFVSRIHEQIMPSINALGLPTATLHGVRLRHYGYTPQAMEAKNKLDRTLSMLQREVDEFPLDPFHWFNLANAYITAGQSTDCARAATCCVKLMPDNAPYGALAYHLLASALIDDGDALGALKQCCEAEHRGFGGILVQFERVRALIALQKMQDAETALDLCLKMPWPEGQNGDYGIFTHKRHVLKGQMFGLMGRWGDALEAFAAALNVDSRCIPAIMGAGLCLLHTDKSREALERFEQCRHDPAEGQRARILAAECHLNLEAFEMAGAECESLWQQGYRTDQVLEIWCRSAEASKVPKALMDVFATLRSQGELSPASGVNFGRLLMHSGDLEGASAVLNQCVEKWPHDPNARFNLGDVLYRRNKFVEAAECYEGALRISPEHGEGWFALGNCLANLGAEHAASDCYDQALAVNPEHLGAKANRDTIRSAA